MLRYANDLVFGLGLLVLCGSVAAWSRPLAGVMVGLVLMAIGAWPDLRRRNGPTE